jgi:hypothetical protein
MWGVANAKHHITNITTCWKHPTKPTEIRDERLTKSSGACTERVRSARRRPCGWRRDELEGGAPAGTNQQATAGRGVQGADDHRQKNRVTESLAVRVGAEPRGVDGPDSRWRAGGDGAQNLALRTSVIGRRRRAGRADELTAVNSAVQGESGARRRAPRARSEGRGTSEAAVHGRGGAAARRPEA